MTNQEKNGYSVAHFPGKELGRAALCVVVGRSFDIDRVEGKCTPQEKTRTIAKSDQLFEGRDPSASSLKRASDMEVRKQKADILLQGTAHAPGGKAISSWEVVFRVGKWRKVLSIIGPRTCRYVAAKKRGKNREPQPPVFGDPESIAEVPLRYENAFGGKGAYIPEDPEAYAKALEQSQEVAARAEAKRPKPPVADPGEEKEGDVSWDDASPQISAKKTDGRLLPEGEGSEGVDLEDELVSRGSESTAILDPGDVEVGALEEEEGHKSRLSGLEVDAEGTPILALAEAGKERVVDEG